MTVAEVLAMPVGELVRMLFDGAPAARPRRAAELLTQEERDIIEQRAREAVRSLRIARARRP